jgi:hypothetical protein
VPEVPARRSVKGESMKFAAGITVSGIIGLIILEIFKIIGPWVKAWVLGVLAIALKVVLIGLVLLFVLTLVGVGVFFYKRGQKAGAGGYE